MNFKIDVNNKSSLKSYEIIEVFKSNDENKEIKLCFRNTYYCILQNNKEVGIFSNIDDAKMIFLEMKKYIKPS